MSRDVALFHPRFYDNPKMKKLKPAEKLLMVYLVTNKHINMAGFDYFEPLFASGDLGLTEDEVVRALDRLHDLGLVRYWPESGALRIMDWFKHNKLRSPKALGYLLSELAKGVLPKEKPTEVCEVIESALDKIKPHMKKKQWQKSIGALMAHLEEQRSLALESEQGNKCDVSRADSSGVWSHDDDYGDNSGIQIN